MLLANITVSGLAEAEKTAKEILEHIEAIKELSRKTMPYSIVIKTDLQEEEAASVD